jgi:hypothetical protein
MAPSRWLQTEFGYKIRRRLRALEETKGLGPDQKGKLVRLGSLSGACK